MTRLIKILESRITGIICLLFALANRVIFTSLYSLIGLDTKLQLTYAENLMSGRGMGITKYFASDLNVPLFDTHQEFPPGFSIVIIPFLKLFGGNEYKAVLAFDIVVAILFVFIVRQVGKKVGLPPALNNVITLMAGCVQYPFFTAWSSTEAICICLLLFSIIHTINIINRKGQLSTLYTIGCGLLFFLPFFFRYVYLPVTIFFPLFIFLSGVLLKNSNLKTGGLKILSVTFLFLILQFSFSLLTAGNALYTVDTERGFFIEQLKECYPFLPASFINLEFGAQLVQIAFGTNLGRFMFWLAIINPFLLALFLLLLWKYVHVNKIKLWFSNHSLFILAGSFVCVIILALLAWLTITYRGQRLGLYEERWVYVSESRYFSFIYAFVPLALFISLYHYRSFLKRRLLFFLLVIGLSCLIIEVMHGIYYNSKILAGHQDLAYYRDSHKRLSSFPATLQEIKSQYPDREVIVCSPYKFYLYDASRLGYKTVFDYSNLLHKGVNVTSGSILVVPIQSENTFLIKEFIDMNKPLLFSSAAGTDYYIKEIGPQ